MVPSERHIKEGGAAERVLVGVRLRTSSGSHSHKAKHTDAKPCDYEAFFSV